ncbi:MAG: hypothetical protein ACD_63C00059G0002 [uncultured bacterium]|nr:MAG: hypothetical protein ACD_63C00059G0002 [uncultured bacterium]
MIDIKLLRKNPKIYKKAAKDKGVDVDIDKLLEIDDGRSKLIQEIDKLRSERNEISDQTKKADQKDRGNFIKRAKEIKGKLSEIEPNLKDIEKEYQKLMGRMPLPQALDVPIGEDDRANKEISKHGEIPKFDFKPKDHIGIGKDLDILDLERGAKISGYRGYVLKNEGVLLHLGLLWFTIKKMVKKGFKPVIPPTLVKKFVLFGSGHFPFCEEDIYKVAEEEHIDEKFKSKEPIYLVGTSEPSLLALYAGKTLKEEDLPIKLCGFSQCYRSEIGSYGKDTKGLYRIHEFMKVEQVVFCKNDIETSEKFLKELLEISKEILDDLKLPYRVVEVCSGDMGPGKYRMYDIETWMPSRTNYGETHSDSNLLDWQARRLNIKYKTADGETRYVYTLNNTAIASPRILIALLESHQQKDGSVVVPEVLRQFTGFDVIKK